MIELSLVVAVLAAMVVAWYLPSIPYANRLVLQPPEETTTPDPAVPVALLGAIGLATTSLRPAASISRTDVIALDRGEPDFPTPDVVIHAMIEALHEGYTHYGQISGDPELRALIASQASRVASDRIDPGTHSSESRARLSSSRHSSSDNRARTACDPE